jgi:hypothetical protein
VAGEHYCIRASAEYKGSTMLLGTITFQKSFLEETPCDTATKESPSAKPTEVKHVNKDAQKIMVNSATFADSK